MLAERVDAAVDEVAGDRDEVGRERVRLRDDVMEPGAVDGRSECTSVSCTMR